MERKKDLGIAKLSLDNKQSAQFSVVLCSLAACNYEHAVQFPN